MRAAYLEIKVQFLGGTEDLHSMRKKARNIKVSNSGVME